ncbi:LysR substrate-binding domain-containing protein [Methylibium sp.]|uniref:LysR substrate-binding domain-containing protein n=1 Tax=Methylibium sp. TaxID=2067992 RepID=UPI003D0E20BC
MELRQMREFLALAEERNFRRAAERLHMAQPPLTRQIRALEEELGTPLFVRTPKGVDLTEAGQVLLDEVPNLLSLANRAKERTQLAGKGMIGRIDVGIFGSGVLDVIPRLLARFHAERPKIEIELHHLSKAQQIEALRERRITVGFNRLFPREPDLVIETVLRERLVVGLYKGHRLCKQREITVRDMDSEPLILYPNSPLPGLAQQVASAFQREGARMNVAQSVEDVLTCVALVAGGFGLCVATESTASLQLPGVVYRPLNCRYLKDIELACIHRRDDLSPILATFVDVVRAFSKEWQGR